MENASFYNRNARKDNTPYLFIVENTRSAITLRSSFVKAVHQHYYRQSKNCEFHEELKRPRDKIHHCDDWSPFLLGLILVFFSVESLESKIGIEVGLVQEVDCVQYEASTKKPSESMRYVSVSHSFHAGAVVSKSLYAKEREL